MILIMFLNQGPNRNIACLVETSIYLYLHWGKVQLKVQSTYSTASNLFEIIKTINEL